MFQIAEKIFPIAMLLGGLSLNLNHLKKKFKTKKLQKTYNIHYS